MGIPLIPSLVAWDAVFRPTAIEKFKVHLTMNRNVGVLRLFPGISLATVPAHTLNDPRHSLYAYNYKGAVVSSTSNGGCGHSVIRSGKHARSSQRLDEGILKCQ